MFGCCFVLGACRVSVIRGRVVSREGNGLIGIRVSVATDPQFGFTLTRSDGCYVVSLKSFRPELVDCSTHQQKRWDVFAHALNVTRLNFSHFERLVVV
ncbi:hypothetical protein CEXT_49991 [Caerostris extrusa]|uniref:Teneurin TTR-like domain-containing protein n=1 Tax=Caerostris extrusa TaxID=172846 RepID=A0AAV4RPP4_CAEEX|nr:hypothetical protein CEXT_49991 [Caerostris extrusa]